MSEFCRIDSAALFTRTVNSSTVLTGVSYTICSKWPHKKSHRGLGPVNELASKLATARQLVRNFQVSQFVVCRKSCTPVIFSGGKHCNQTIGRWGFTRHGVFNCHNTHTQQHKSGTMEQVLQGFAKIYIEGHRRVVEITVHTLTFPFTWFSLSVFLHVFSAVYLKCFSAISFIVRFCHSLF
jgi:hypothetical protein